MTNRVLLDTRSAIDALDRAREMLVNLDGEKVIEDDGAKNPGRGEINRDLLEAADLCALASAHTRAQYWRGRQ